MLFKMLESCINNSDIKRITVDVKIEGILTEETDLSQSPLSSKDTLLDIIDDKTFDEWSNFESAVRDYIDQNYMLLGISMSRNTSSISEYIDFQVLGDDGNVKEVVIELRLSNHRPTHTAKETQRRKLKRVYNNVYRMVGVTVNNETYDTYSKAFEFVKKVIDDSVSSI